jgi:AraC-like DNA-binding protein
MSMTAPLSSFGVMRTRDVEAARGTLRDTYGATHFDLRGRSSRFQAQANFVKLDNLALSYCHYNEQVHLSFPGASFVRQQICIGGSGRTAFGNHRIDVDKTNWSAVIPAGADMRFEYLPTFRQVVVWIEMAVLEKALTSILGTTRYEMSFNSQCDVRSPALQSLRRSVAFIMSELEICGDQSSPVALAEMQDMAVARFLYSHQPDLIQSVGNRLQSPSGKQMRLLEDYLIAHWNEPITVDRLAQVANVGARSIFRYFKTTRGCSPLEFVKILRLEHARTALQSPRQVTTVSAEALRCGFNNMGHFAKDYRKRFGELPSQTLARAQS